MPLRESYGNIVTVVVIKFASQSERTTIHKVPKFIALLP